MAYPRVIVLPRLDDESVADLVTQLADLVPNEVVGLGSVGSELAENQWVAAVALGIARSGAAFEPIHLVAVGDTAQRFPAVAFAQRAARRPVLSYVCVDVVPSGQFVDWPDAPVTLIKSNPLMLAEVSNAARLRGWTQAEADPGELPAAVAAALVTANP